jgi:hypothetical protein
MMQATFLKLYFSAGVYGMLTFDKQSAIDAACHLWLQALIPSA